MGTDSSLLVLVFALCGTGALVGIIVPERHNPRLLAWVGSLEYRDSGSEPARRIDSCNAVDGRRRADRHTRGFGAAAVQRIRE